MTSRLFLGLAATLLLLTAGCKEPDGSSGGTSGAALYAFDSTTNAVFIWKDVSAVYDATTTPSPSFQITSSLFSKVSSLAWGGLAFDRQRGILYLVSDTGTIVRVNNIRSQSGAVPNGEVYSFSLASTGRLTNGKFGQIALDPQNDTLFITETGDSNTQIWVVASASAQIQDATVALQALQMSGDSGGTGVAAASGTVYAFMKDGGTVGTDALTGPRLRKGNAVSFDASQVILGSSTTLGIYGSLALDTGNGYLFVARHNTDAASTAAPIQAFRTGQFGLSYNQAPALTVGTAAGQPDLRVLSHPGTKDWLVGLRGNGTTGYNTIYLWKSPLGGTAAKVATAASGSVFKGVAVDGNAS
ncbi:hypothetical protein [Geothrix sp. PMB-07]|uniref:hypothetical protein n=1 Tax=Geothrix sp. PMB-07 TaxID=3068640 RepID=UPI0027421D42|nr:hypothetical protein [Geothrix sp. PMB-07]WLT30348.1 hypothetical protein Q9293_11525 [Geothrix sp. PMB-07]